MPITEVFIDPAEVVCVSRSTPKPQSMLRIPADNVDVVPEMEIEFDDDDGEGARPKIRSAIT